MNCVSGFSFSFIRIFVLFDRRRRVACVERQEQASQVKWIFSSLSLYLRSCPINNPFSNRLAKSILREQNWNIFTGIGLLKSLWLQTMIEWGEKGMFSIWLILWMASSTWAASWDFVRVCVCVFVSRFFYRGFFKNSFRTFFLINETSYETFKSSLFSLLFSLIFQKEPHSHKQAGRQANTHSLIRASSSSIFFESWLTICFFSNINN